MKHIGMKHYFYFFLCLTLFSLGWVSSCSNDKSKVNSTNEYTEKLGDLANKYDSNDAVFLLTVSEENNTYFANVPAQLAVNAIVDFFNDHQAEGFSSNQSEAVRRLEQASDSIMNYNWQQNSLAIQPGSQFSLNLSVSIDSTWNVIDSRALTLPTK